MMRIFYLLFISSCFAGPAGCTPSPVTPMPDGQADGASAPTAQGACDEMAAIGCLVRSTCAATINKVNADPNFAHIDVVCVAAAKNANEVLKCGVDCTVVSDGGR
jgi:hypothetical protein